MCNGLAELLTIPENMKSQPLFSGVCVARSLVVFFFIFIFISISYLDIRCRQNIHGRSAVALGFHHQHDKV
jgi:hypothetical protein